MFMCDPALLSDIEVNTAPTKVKAFFQSKTVGLELQFGRVSIPELQAKLADDCQRWLKFRGGQDGASEDDIGHQGKRIVKWSSENCMDDEGKIPLLDFKQLIVNGLGPQVRIRQGRIESSSQAWYSCSFDNLLFPPGVQVGYNVGQNGDIFVGGMNLRFSAGVFIDSACW
jgi:hypothetical protein